MPTRRQNQSLEVLAEAREYLQTSDADPQRVVESLQRVSEELEHHEMDAKEVDAHLERHRELAGDDGFTPVERRDCLETLRRLHRGLRAEFETDPVPQCLACGMALPQGADRDLCYECRDNDGPVGAENGRGGEDSGSADDSEIDKTVINIDGSSQININSDSSSNEEITLESTAHEWDGEQPTTQFSSPADSRPSESAGGVDSGGQSITGSGVGKNFVSEDAADSYSLEAVVSKSDNLMMAREESTSECLNRAKSLERLLVRLNTNRDDVDLSNAIEEVSSTVSTIEAAISKPKSGIESNNALKERIKDTVVAVKDVSYTQLGT